MLAKEARLLDASPLILAHRAPQPHLSYLYIVHTTSTMILAHCTPQLNNDTCTSRTTPQQCNTVVQLSLFNPTWLHFQSLRICVHQMSEHKYHCLGRVFG